MLPAREGLHTANGSIGQRDDGLVVHAQLALAQSSTELELGLQPLACPRVHRTVKDFEAALAQGLGGIERHVGFAQQLVRRLARAAHGHANADPYKDVLHAELKWLRGLRET